MDGVLEELSRQLLGCADALLLDAPLSEACRSIGDAHARELLMGLFEAGTAARLRELLEDGRLARWAEQCCTAREEESLVLWLRSSLEAQSAGPDDPERLVPQAAPPTDPEALFTWAAQHEVTRLLVRPARELLPSAANLPAETTLAACCLGQLPPPQRGASLLASEGLVDDARAFLAREVQRAAALHARSLLHERPLPPAPLAALARRLRALFAACELETLHAYRFLPARAVSLELATGRSVGALHQHGVRAPIALRLELSGFEQRALAGACSACGRPPCVHLAVLAARLFEACQNADDRLHEPLREFARIPSWRRFLAALGPEPTSAATDGPRICFSLRVEGGRIAVGAQLRRLQEDGGLTKGKLASAQSLARSRHATERDQRVLSALAARGRTVAPQYTPADLMVLRSLVEHPAVILDGAGRVLRVSEESLHVELLEQPEGLIPRVTLAGAAVARSGEESYAVALDVGRAALTFAAVTPALARLLAALEHFHGVLPPESYPELAPWLSALAPSARVSMPRALAGMERPPPERLLLRMTPRFDEGLDVLLTVRALPLAPLWLPGEGPLLVHGLVDGVQSSVRRDLDHERAQAERILDTLGLREQLELAPYSYRIESTQAALSLLSAAARLERELELEWAERARPLRVSATVGGAQLKVSLFKHGDWCALEGGVQLGERLVPIARLLEAARQGERFVPIEGSDYVEIEQALFDRLAQAQLCTLTSARGLGLSPAALPHFQAQLGAHTHAGDLPTVDWLARARAAEHAPTVVASPIRAELRDYQAAGVAWLLQRSEWSSGACLADEMGLGKTVQAIAVLAARSTLGPALVIAPTSVVDTWLRELDRFAPALSARVYRGEKRQAQRAALAPGSVLVASYDVVLRDSECFAGVDFATLVIDEAQWLKNARTLRARAVATLTARFRLALTGTPIENRLADLWSLFHLLAPGLLGSWSLFRARFAVPIERYENEERAAALRALIAPLLLRRTKAQVARELPPRTEVVHLVEPSQAERDLYTAALVQARRALKKRKRSPDDTSRTMQILAELTRLRQLACHPRLVVEDARVSSSKMKALTQLLEDLLPRGHRVLIFSQFVRHLALVRAAVEKLGASYVYLDGQTESAARTRAVDSFQRGEAQLFLISLKAGGTGLNLTAADYVVHMDPWWNPSAEDQASDRAHRIGQLRPVTVVKLVTQGSIEERVLLLHEHKRRLTRSILTPGEDAPSPLEPEELEALLVD